MKQQQFIKRYQHEWQAFEEWLEDIDPNEKSDTLQGYLKEKVTNRKMPAYYRRICQQLALARKRGYSPQVTDYLQNLMQRGHDILYYKKSMNLYRIIEFILYDFPIVLRQEKKYLLVSALLFLIPLVGIFVLLQYHPDMIYKIMAQQDIKNIERMYNENDPRFSQDRDFLEDLKMFGFYIYNNIGIGLRTFGSGLLFGVGTIFVLITNGVNIAAAAGHLHAIDSSSTFWPFVIGHGSFELTAIVISGAAGLRLGFSLLMPGQRKRSDALIEAGYVGAKLCLGAAIMLLIAAFLEAFWSSNHALPVSIKYGVGTVLWVGVFFWLARGGYGYSIKDTLLK